MAHQAEEGMLADELLKGFAAYLEAVRTQRPAYQILAEFERYNEWTFFAPVGLIQSASLLGRRCSGLSLMELFLLLALNSLASSLFPTAFADRLPRPMPVADCSVTRFWPRFRYLAVVRLLAQHRSPLRL
jgi:hypothetical protein